MATIPTFSDWINGENVTDTKMNSQIRDAGNFFKKTPCARLIRTSDVSVISNSTYQNLATNVEAFDNDSMADPTNSRMVIQTPGVYWVRGIIRYKSNATGNRGVSVFATGHGFGSTNDRVLNHDATAPSLDMTIECSGLLRLPVGAILTLQSYQSSGVSLTTVATAGAPSLEAMWVASLP